MQVYDRVIYRSGLNTLTALLVGMVIILGADLVLRSVRARVLRVSAVRLDAEIANQLMRKLLRIPLRELEAKHRERGQSAAEQDHRPPAAIQITHLLVVLGVHSRQALLQRAAQVVRAHGTWRQPQD